MESVKRSKRYDDWLTVFGIVCGEIDTLLPCSDIVAWHAVCVNTRTEMETDTWSALKRVQVHFAGYVGYQMGPRSMECTGLDLLRGRRPEEFQPLVYKMIHRASPLKEQKADGIISYHTLMVGYGYDHVIDWLQRAFRSEEAMWADIMRFI